MGSEMCIRDSPFPPSCSLRRRVGARLPALRRIRRLGQGWHAGFPRPTQPGAQNGIAETHPPGACFGRGAPPSSWLFARISPAAPGGHPEPPRGRRGNVHLALAVRPETMFVCLPVAAPFCSMVVGAKVTTSGALQRVSVDVTPLGLAALLLRTESVLWVSMASGKRTTAATLELAAPPSKVFKGSCLSARCLTSKPQACASAPSEILRVKHVSLSGLRAPLGGKRKLLERRPNYRFTRSSRFW